jgi:hypothetical protein
VKAFFSEEKKQKTFIPSRVRTGASSPRMRNLRDKQKTIALSMKVNE